MVWGKILPRRRTSRGFSLSLRERVWGEGKEQDFLKQAREHLTGRFSGIECGDGRDARGAEEDGLLSRCRG